MNRHARWVRSGFYGILLLVLLSILTGALEAVVPAGLAGHVSRNSEGYVMVLVLAAWIEFVRPRMGRGPRAVMVTLGAAAACLAIGFYLDLGPLPSVVGTLNEAFFALAVLLCWVQLPRPLPQVAWLLPVVSLLTAVFFASHPDVVAAAEYLAAYVVFPIGLDLVDPGILRRGVPTSRQLVVAWMGLLVVFALVVHELPALHLVDGVEDIAAFLSRITEALVAMFLTHLYLTLLDMAPARRRERAPVGTAA
jgi:hypothetical protein